MIIKLIENKEFSFESLFNELEVKELLFLSFSNSLEDEEELEYIYAITDDIGGIDDFYKVINKLFGSRVKKAKKEQLIKSLTEQFDEQFLSTMVYKGLYNYSLKDNNILFNSKLIILERFCSILFRDRIVRMEEVLMSKLELREVDIIEEFKTNFLYPNRPTLNTLGMVSLLGRMKIIKNKYDSLFIFFKELEAELLVLLIEQLDILDKKKFSLLESKINEKDKKIANLEKTVTKVKEQFKELAVKTNQLKKDNKLLESTKKSFDYSLVDKLKEKIELLTQELDKKSKEFELFKDCSEKETRDIQESYKKEVHKLQNEMAILKGNYKKEVTALEGKINSMKSVDIRLLLEDYVEKNGLNESLLEIFENYIEEFHRLRDRDKQVEENEVEYERSEQKIGYCLIENNIHYAVFPDSSRIEIKEIPDNVYLGKLQFVKVTNDGVFKWLYTYKFDSNERDTQISEFGSVCYQENEPYFMKGVWDKKKINNLPSYINLKENQVISINNKGELYRFYKNVTHSADMYLDSIEAKGQKAYYLLKIFPNGFLVRDIKTGIEEFRIVDTGDVTVKEQQIICVNESNQLVHVYYSSKFYTLSQYYDKVETGVIEIQNEVIYVRKLSGEVAIVNNISPKIMLGDGDVVTVDEFNNLLKVKKEYVQVELTAERKRLASSNRQGLSKKSMIETIKIKKDVLIIGKVTYENSYKMALYKHGYRAEVVEGYEPWTKVKFASKNKDIIVVVTEYISHDNMWKLKNETTNIPVIYSEYDGANRIVEQIEEFDRNECLDEKRG